MIDFEWNPHKAESNLKKHNVSFEEASTVFGDTLSTTFPDSDHSIHEERYLIIGFSSQNRILVISHTYRGEKIRIISARQATTRERKFYEDGK
jgi:uncharacterized DUF497 family protein